MLGVCLGGSRCKSSTNIILCSGYKLKITRLKINELSTCCFGYVSCCCSSCCVFFFAVVHITKRNGRALGAHVIGNERTGQRQQIRGESNENWEGRGQVEGSLKVCKK